MKNHNKMPVRAGIAAIAAGALALTGCSTEAAPTPSTVTATVTVENTATPQPSVEVNAAAETLAAAKAEASKAMSEQGRITAKNILKYLADTEVSHAVPYQAGVEGGTLYDGIENKSYNVSRSNEADWIAEAFVRTAEPGKIAINIFDGHRAENGKWNLTASISQTANISAVRTNQISDKQLRGEPLTLQDFNDAVDDPLTTFETGVTNPGEPYSQNASSYVDNLTSPEEIVAAQSNLTQQLTAATSALKLG